MGHSMYEIISKKRDGGILSTEEIQFVIDGYVGGDIPDYQVSALLMAVYLRDLNEAELVALTEAMKNSGKMISLQGVPGKKIDKHSTGGVGDKVSFIVAPLAAACGVKVPMLSGRGLGHTGGTLDKLESIPGFNVFLKPEQMRHILRDVGMVICGQTDNVVPADKKIYALRDTTATVNSLPLIASSIMSKKLALGTDGIVLDVKTGSGAFMRGEAEAIELCRTLVDLGERAGRRTVGLVTNMDQPLGRAVGNSLEIVESIEALKGKGPGDLMEVCFAVAAAMLLAGEAAVDYPAAMEKLEHALGSGAALNTFKKFIAAQGGNARVCDDYRLLPTGGFQVNVTADTGGCISRIDALEVGTAAVAAGAGRRKKEDPVDHGAGFVFLKKVGDFVKKGESILTIHTSKERKGEIESIKNRLLEAIRIDSHRVPKPKMISHRVDKEGVTEWDQKR